MIWGDGEKRLARVVVAANSVAATRVVTNGVLTWLDFAI